MQPRSARSITVGQLLVLGILVIIIGYMAFPPAQETRHGPVLMNDSDRLSQLGISLEGFQEVHGRFPAQVFVSDTGQSHSWRVLLLPFFGEAELLEAYHMDEPWNGPNNRLLLQRMPDIYRSTNDWNMPLGHTRYVALGRDQNGESRLAISRKTSGTGSSDMPLIVQLKQCSVPWTAPIDVTYSDDDNSTRKFKLSAGGICNQMELEDIALLRSGRVRSLK